MKNNSVLGFHTYQVVIPGISEIVYNKTGYLEMIEEENEIKRLVRRVKKSSYKQLEYIFNYFESREDMWDTSLIDFLNLPISRKSPFYYATISFLLGNISIKLKRYEKASLFINRYIKYLEGMDFDQESLNYFKVFRDYFVCRKLQINMELFYDKRTINVVQNSLENPNLIFSSFPAFDGDCKACSLRNDCYNNIRERYQVNRKRILSENLFEVVDIEN